MSFLVNLLFAFLAFFLIRYVGNMVAPDGQDKDKIVVVVAVIVAILVFFANFASQVL